MDRRQFTLQLYDRVELPPLVWSPPMLVPGELPAQGVTSAQLQQIMFANLRRRVVIDEQWPFPGTTPESAMCPDFRDAWMDDCQQSHMTPVVVVVVVRTLGECGCPSCKRALISKALSPIASSCYHVHIQDSIGATVSVGIMAGGGAGGDRWIFRDWDPPALLNTHDDYEHAIGMALDDALHQSALYSLDNDEIYMELINRTEAILKPRIPTGTHIVAIDSSISNSVTHCIAKVGVDLKTGTRRETVVVTRSISTTGQ